MIGSFYHPIFLSSYFFAKSVAYSPYPSAASLLTGMNRIDAEFMQ